MSNLVFAHLLVASTFLNGVNIDGVRPLIFEKCKTVQIDVHGDVRLDCPAYQVETVAARRGLGQTASPETIPVEAMTPVVPVQITKHYWLVSEQAGAGDSQYEVDLFINAKWVRKLRSSEDQVVMEISKLLQPGPNKLLLAATKTLAGGKRAAAPGATLKIIIGEGQAVGGNILIDNPLVEYKRSAAETANLDEEFVVQAR
jgi:hypothetical protein